MSVETGKHLWEVEHRYYCNLGNYYSNDCGHEYKSWAEFMADEGDSDMDYNLLFRWDWQEREDAPYNGDPNYRNGSLELFWIGQRKGVYRFTTVEVCRNDEPAVIAYLEPRMRHLLSLWEPLAPALPEAGATP